MGDLAATTSPTEQHSQMTDLTDKELECHVTSGAKCLAKVAGDGGEHD